MTCGAWRWWFHQQTRRVSCPPTPMTITSSLRPSPARLISSPRSDKHDLLPMGSYAGIAIVTAREDVQRLEAKGET